MAWVRQVLVITVRCLLEPKRSRNIFVGLGLKKKLPEGAG